VNSTITAKGQTTIPKPIREHLHLKAGDRVKYFVHPDGSVVLLPIVPVAVLRGSVKSRRPHPPTIEEMDEDIAAEAAGLPRQGKGR
jgi:AbrB family looped-hinge helix DNA binding protein